MRYKVFLDTNILLSGIFFEGPDYFLTGDAHFHTDKVRDVVTVMTAKEFLNKIRKK